MPDRRATGLRMVRAADVNDSMICIQQQSSSGLLGWRLSLSSPCWTDATIYILSGEAKRSAATFEQVRAHT